MVAMKSVLLALSLIGPYVAIVSLIVAGVLIVL
jgi:hypothetical protein